MLKIAKTSILNTDTCMSVTVASEQTKQQKESGSVTKSANLQPREKERKRANGRKGGKRRYRPLRRSGVNGTAKVYFVEEREGCLPRDHGAPWWGCRRAKGPAGPWRLWAEGEERAGVCIWGDRGRRKVARRGGKCSSSSSSSCRCQCPPSCYPRRGPLEDIGADHGGPSASQPVAVKITGQH